MIVDDEREERGRLVSWIYLIVAGLLEIGWPVGLKMSQEAETRVMGILLAVGFMAASGFCLWMAQKQIPIGTAYAVWTGIGAAGTFLVGVMFYGDPSSLARYFGVALIVAGVVVLKLAH
ncbi:putative exporter protein (SMR family) [Alteromonas macleodii str. 'Balearic Sea AD45']|nr:putative exporter protein (SMR family) [Alteromonas macleodii str. 'Balearic Sea AD45']